MQYIFYNTSIYSGLLCAVIMQGNSRGYLYHDDFHSLAYRQGEYILCEITMQSGTSLSSRQVLHSSVDAISVISGYT